MKFIKVHKPRNSGHVWTAVDDDMYEELNKHKWQLTKLGYVGRSKKNDGKPTFILMHRVVMDTPKGMVTDHIDQSKLNNCRRNLRICTQQENLRNRGANKNNKLGYRGIKWVESALKYSARITVNKKTIHIGYFESLVEAVYAWNREAIKYHGEFAHLNKEIPPFADGGKENNLSR
jgi:hypothetical protein